MIEHRDINGKALALLLVCALGVVVISTADRLPVRTVTVANAVNAPGAEGGRLYSSPVGPPGGSIPLGLDYHVPRPDYFPWFSRAALEKVRDAGLLRGYSLPPKSLAFLPDGRPIFLPRPPIPEGPREPCTITCGNRGNPRVALTFDDGYDAETILDLLTGLRVPATFFLQGWWYERNPDFVREAARRGFELANHSYSHPAFTRITDEQMVDELRRSEQALAANGVSMSAYFRPPYGAVDDRVKRVVGRCGYVIVMWCVDTLDWNPATTPQGLLERATAGVRNGDILLFHTHGRHTAAMLPRVVETLRARGFELTTVSSVIRP